MDENRAIARLKNGDIAGLQTLVELYQAEAVQAAYLITNDPAAAEDLVQSAFIRAFNKIKGFDSARPFRPWFLRIVVNDAIKFATRQRRQMPLQDEDDGACQNVLQELSASVLQPEDALQQKEQIEAIQKALDDLSPTQKAAIVMRYFLNLSTAETAQQLHCTPGTIRWHLSLARERLRVLLTSLK